MRDVRNNEISNLWYSLYQFIMCNIFIRIFLSSQATCRPIGYVYLVKYCILSNRPTFTVDFCQH